MLTLITLVFINCEKETTPIEEVISEQAISVKRIFENEIKENTQLISELNKFKSSKISMQSLSREEYNSDYGFSVETTEAIFIENGDYHSYTFKVYRKEGNNVLENLLLSQQGDLSYRAFLISYDITEQERELITRNEYISLADKIESTELVDFDADAILYQRDGECYEWVEETSQATGWTILVKKQVACQNDSISGEETNNGGGGTGGGSGNAGGDDQENPGTSEDEGSGSSSGSGSSGGSSGDNPEPEEITSPTLSTEEIALAEILDCVSLPPDLGSWLWEQSQLPRNNVNSSIQSFIQQNGCTPETETFIQLAVEALLNEGDVDFPNSIILDSTFQNINKVKCTYERIKQNTNFKNLLDNFIDEDTPYNLTFKVEPDLECNQSNDPTGCTKSSLNSDNSVTISIDQDYINSNQTPTLFIAETLIHETIHANLYLALYNYNNGNTANLPSIDDFPAIYEQYRQYQGWQHEFMAGEYTSLIAQILQEIHPNLNDQTFIDSLADYEMSLSDFYTCIAYIGLNDTVGQANFLNDPTNAANYNISYFDAQANSTKTPNCN